MLLLESRFSQYWSTLSIISFTSSSVRSPIDFLLSVVVSPDEVSVDVVLVVVVSVDEVSEEEVSVVDEVSLFADCWVRVTDLSPSGFLISDQVFLIIIFNNDAISFTDSMASFAL